MTSRIGHFTAIMVPRSNVFFISIPTKESGRQNHAETGRFRILQTAAVRSAHRACDLGANNFVAGFRLIATANCKVDLLAINVYIHFND
jgi:hypothetical protein